MTKQELKKAYKYYLSEKQKEDNSETHLKNIKFLELALLRSCIDKVLKESEA